MIKPILPVLLAVMCLVPLTAVETALPGPILGVRLGMSRPACLAALGSEAKAIDNGDGVLGVVQEGSWFPETDAAVPEAASFMRLHAYGPLDRICLQGIDRRKVSCEQALWALFNAGQCDRLLLAVVAGPRHSLEEAQRSVEAALGRPFPAMQPSARPGTMTASIHAPEWSATASRRTANAMDRLVVEVRTANARRELTQDELRLLDDQAKARLTIRPTDEILLAPMRMPTGAPDLPTFRKDYLTPAAYADMAQALRRESAFEAQVASGRGPSVLVITDVNRTGQGTQLGLHPKDAILSIDGAPLVGYADFVRLRDEGKEQDLAILAPDGQVRSVRAGPGKIGVNMMPDGIGPWMPIEYLKSGVHGPWDADAITACLALDCDAEMAEQALAQAIAQGWKDPMADRMAGEIRSGHGEWRGAVDAFRSAHAGFAKQGAEDAGWIAWTRMRGAMSTAGWALDAAEAVDAVPGQPAQPVVPAFLAALRDLPAGDAQRDLSRQGLETEPRYGLRSLLDPLVGSRRDVELAKALCADGQAELTAQRGFRDVVWDNLPDHCEVTFILETQRTYVWSGTQMVTVPELRFGLAHRRENDRLETTRLYANFNIDSSGMVMAERRNAGRALHVRSGFRLDGRPHRFRFVRWGLRVRLEIDGISVGETLVDTSRLGTAPHLVLWMQTTHPLMRGRIRDFEVIGFGEPSKTVPRKGTEAAMPGEPFGNGNDF